jgi:hypothetical protein
MSAYATARPGRSSLRVPFDLPDGSLAAPIARSLTRRSEAKPAEAFTVTDGVIDGLIGQLAERIASTVVAIEGASLICGGQSELVDSYAEARGYALPAWLCS